MNVLQALKSIADPRKRQGRQYPFYGLLAILLLAAMHGERSLRGMWLWACQRQTKLLSCPALGLRAVKRIPGLATFWHALRKLKGGEMERALQGLIQEENDLALDGKWLRGSRREAVGALHVITLAGVRLRQVWEQNGVVGGDELEAALALLEEFPLEGKVISADAALLKAPFVQKVVKKGGLHRLDQGQSSGIAPGNYRLDWAANGASCRLGSGYQRAWSSGAAFVVALAVR